MPDACKAIAILTTWALERKETTYKQKLYLLDTAKVGENVNYDFEKKIRERIHSAVNLQSFFAAVKECTKKTKATDWSLKDRIRQQLLLLHCHALIISALTIKTPLCLGWLLLISIFISFGNLATIVTGLAQALHWCAVMLRAWKCLVTTHPNINPPPYILEKTQCFLRSGTYCTRRTK